MATDVFFVCMTDLAKESSDGIGMGAHTGCIKQGGGRFGHCDVAILTNDPGKEYPVRIELPLAFRAALWRGTRLTCASGSQAPIAHPWQATASAATPPYARSTLLQSISEAAPEAHSAMVLT